MNKLARNTLALGTATLIVTAGLSFSANGADPIVAQANSSAVTATGITQIVDSKRCSVSSTGAPTVGTAEVCGTGLSTSGVNAFAQTASTGLDGTKGTSTAASSVAPIDIPTLTTIDPSTLGADLDQIDTGTILDDVVAGLDPVTGPLFEALLTPLLSGIQDAALAPLLAALQDAVPVSIQVGAVSSQCTLTAGGAPSLTSTVAGINILIELAPGNVITVPITLNTSPNSALVGSVAPRQIVDGLLVGIETTLSDSLGGALGTLATLVPTIQDILVDAVLVQLGPALDAIGTALIPIVDGTVNKQVVNADGSGEVTALELNVLGTTATLKLARSACGPNGTVVVSTTPTPTKTTPTKSTDADTAADQDAAADANADANADTVADADAAADADVTTTLPATGAPNLVPFWLLGIALLMFGGAVLLNEKRRLNQI